MSIQKITKLMTTHKVEFVDMRFTDSAGKEHHMSVPAGKVDKDFYRYGKMFDGSSIAGWKTIDNSDMVLIPDVDTAVLDPFTEHPTLNLRCDVIDPGTGKGYDRDPRSIARRAEAYLKKTGIADAAFFGPENEFFVFDDVRWGTDIGSAFYSIDSLEAAWNSSKEYEDGNSGHRPKVKGGYFPVPPVDNLQDLRSLMCKMMEEMGLQTEVHHHEVGTAGQSEIGVRFNTLMKKADEVQIYKYVVHNTAHQEGLTATFMPKPFIADNGSGMHVHQSLSKGGKNLFTGNDYGGLSKLALYYIGGILKHAHALNAFTNASTNSYKRLVPGYEAPIFLTYSARNRSAACRIPHVPNPKARRIELRFPDSTANPYLAFAAMLMAGIDGIRNKIHPGDPTDINLYALTEGEQDKFPKIVHRLGVALRALNEDKAFLLEGGVFTEEMIQAYIDLKMEDVDRLRMTANPVEFDMYYSV